MLLLLSLMICLPYMMMGVKAILLFVILLLILLSGSMRHIYIKRYTIWIVLFYLSGVFSLMYGALKGNPGVHYYYLTSLVWPILIPVILTTIGGNQVNTLIKLFHLLYGIIVLTGVLSFVQINFGVIPFFDYTWLGFKPTDRPLFMFRAIQGGCLNSFYAIFPFLLSYYCLAQRKVGLANIFVILSGMVFIILTSRRIFILSLLYIPIVIFILSKLSHYKAKKIYYNTIYIYIIPVIFFSSLVGYFFMDMDTLTSFFSSAAEDNVENIRLLQYKALIRGWLDNFLLGAGDGINAGGVISSDLPGSYELSYMAILFARGTLGAGIYFGLLIVLIIWAVKLIRRLGVSEEGRFLLSYCVTYITFLIANATNPYLGSFDHYWVLFLFVFIQSVEYKKILLHERQNLYINKGLQQSSGS